MIYAILKFLMKLTGKGFFRSITVKNKEYIPKKGPLLVLANHPSSFMDPIMIATLLDFQVYFLAKGELFKTKIARWILPKFNVIPIYRQQDDPSLMGKNEETFVKCFEHLEKGGAILIFPEGISITERRLKPVKTGAARIVLGAEARNDFNLNVQLLTIGLNYTNPHQFNRDLYINIDKPIPASDYKDEYFTDPIKGVQALTETIRESLEKLIIDVQDANTDQFARNIEKIYKYKLTKDLGIAKDDKEAKFNLSKTITEVANYFYQNQPERAAAMNQRMKGYLENLLAVGLRDYDLQASQKNDSILYGSLKTLFLVVAGLPFYVYGLINNYVAFKIPDLVANKMVTSIEFKGPIAMATGMLTFLLFYIFQSILVWKWTENNWLTLAYIVSLPLSGLFAYKFHHFLKRIRSKWLILIIFYRKSRMVASLISEREQLIDEFDEARKEYDKIKGLAK